MLTNKPQFLTANWNAPSNVKTLITTKIGVSGAKTMCNNDTSIGIDTLDNYSNFNLATHVGDNLAHVQLNRSILRQYLPDEPKWLNQQHTNKIINLDQPTGSNNFNNEILVNTDYDASYTCNKNVVCVVMTADCLPILFTNQQGTFVAALHAGWRGLENGIIDNLFIQLKQININSDEIIVYLGPSISQPYFEVGIEVYQLFIQQNELYSKCFLSNPENPHKFYCDMQAIAKMQLTKAGISIDNIFSDKYCSYDDSNLFYSHRRDKVSGRFASLIWLE